MLARRMSAAASSVRLLSEATGFSPEDLYPRYVRLGDPGDLAAEIIKEAEARFSTDHYACRNGVADHDD